MYAYASPSSYASRPLPLGAFGNVSGDLAHFETQVNRARDSIALIPEYVTKLRNAAAKERTGSLFGSSQADALDNFAKTLENQIPNYKAILDKAIAEGSFTRLRDLQTILKNAITLAGSEAKNILPPTMRLFIDTVIVGTVVQVPQAAKNAIQATADSVLAPVAGAVSKPLMWIALAALAVGVPYALYNIRKLA